MADDDEERKNVRRENKPQVPECGAEAVKAEKKRNKWAAGVSKKEASTVGVHMTRNSGPHT